MTSIVSTADPGLIARLPGQLQAIFWPGDPVPSAGHLALWGLDDGLLDEAVAALGFATGEPAELPTVLPRTARAHTRVATASVPALLVPILPALATLVALPPGDEWAAWRRRCARHMWGVVVPRAA